MFCRYRIYDVAHAGDGSDMSDTAASLLRRAGHTYAFAPFLHSEEETLAGRFIIMVLAGRGAIVMPRRAPVHYILMANAVI